MPQFLVFAILPGGEKLPLALARDEAEADRKMDGYRTMFAPDDQTMIKKEVQDPPVEEQE